MMVSIRAKVKKKEMDKIAGLKNQVRSKAVRIAQTKAEISRSSKSTESLNNALALITSACDRVQQGRSWSDEIEKVCESADAWFTSELLECKSGVVEVEDEAGIAGLLSDEFEYGIGLDLVNGLEQRVEKCKADSAAIEARIAVLTKACDGLD